MNNRRRIRSRLMTTVVTTALIGAFGAAVTPVSAAAQSADLTPTVNPNPAHYNAATTVSVPGLPADATGDLYYADQYYDLLCTATLPDTSCTFAEGSVFPGGTLTVTANYSGDSNYPPANVSVDVPITVTPVSGVVTAAQASQAYGSAVEFDLGGLPSDASGTVDVTDQNGDPLCTITLPGNQSCFASPKPGTYDYTGAYSGDGQYSDATLTGGSVTVTKQDTTVTVSASAFDHSSPVTFAVGSLPPDATGTVEVDAVGGAPLCTVAYVPGASCAAPAGSFAAGPQTVDVSYSGDDIYLASTGTEQFDVAQTVTSVAAVTGGNYAQGATSTTLSVTGLPADATGTVDFTDNDSGLTLCTGDVASGCHPDPHLAIGDYQVTANYYGDTNYRSSYSTNDASFSVIDPEALKTPVTLTATVSPATPDYVHGGKVTVAGLPTDATGKVTVSFPDEYGVRPCVVALSGAGSVTCAVPAKLEPGLHRMTAAYGGDGAYRHATLAKSVTVVKAATVMKITADKSRYHYGTVNVFHLSGLGGDHGGVVRFTNQYGKVICSPAYLPAYQGIVNCPEMSLPVGIRTVTATYTGDSHYKSATTRMTVTVTAPLPATHLRITATPITQKVGKPFTLTSGGLPRTATGSVVFLNEYGYFLCRAAAPAGRCTVSRANLRHLGVGKHAVIGIYSGNATHAMSQATIRITVTRA
jgi:hypothetical protein